MSNLVKRENAVANRDRKIREIDRDTEHDCDMVIADLSSSMSSPAFGGKSRYACLQEALTPYLGQIQVLAFNNHVWEVDADSLPSPNGFTAMHLAFEEAIKLTPIHVLVISDGCPDSKEAAIKAAEVLAKKRVIDVMYIGPKNQAAEMFMQQLAELGRGRYTNFEIDKGAPALLETKIGQLLALPSPGTIQL